MTSGEKKEDTKIDQRITDAYSAKTACCLYFFFQHNGIRF
ncbi:hypothetical protein EFW57_01476 [Bacillus velezensis]|nr:hypothetical protein EFW57_01476 [Bacillus velezensis]